MAESRAEKLAQRFSRSFTWQTIGNVLGTGMAVLGSVLVVRLLGAEKYGSYVIVFSLIQVVRLAISFGHELTINTYLPELMATGQNGQVAYLLREILKRRLVWLGIVAPMLFCTAGLIAKGFQVPELALYIRLGIPLMGLGYIIAVFRNIFTAKVHTRGVVKLGIFVQGLSLILLYLFLSRGWGIPGLLLSMIISDMVSLIVLGYISREYFRNPVESMDTATTRSYGYSIWLQGLLGYLLGKQADITLMGLFKVPLASIGCYNLGHELANKTSLLVHGGNAIQVSSMSESYASLGLAGLRANWVKIYKLTNLLVFPLMVFAAVNCQEIITILYTNKMAKSATLFLGLILALAFAQLSGQSLCKQGLYVLHKEKAVLKTLVFSGALNLLLNLALIPLMGAMGAVLATSVSLAMNAGILAGLFWRETGWLYPSGFVLRLILGSALAVLPTLWWRAEQIHCLALEGISFLLCFALTLTVWQGHKLLLRG